MYVNRKQAIVALLKIGNVVEVRGFCELSIDTVRPAMISTCQNLHIADILVHQGKSSVSTDIVEAVYLAVSIEAQKEGKSCFSVAQVVPNFLEADLVRDEHPFF